MADQIPGARKAHIPTIRIRNNVVRTNGVHEVAGRMGADSTSSLPISVCLLDTTVSGFDM